MGRNGNVSGAEMRKFIEQGVVNYFEVAFPEREVTKKDSVREVLLFGGEKAFQDFAGYISVSYDLHLDEAIRMVKSRARTVRSCARAIYNHLRSIEMEAA